MNYKDKEKFDRLAATFHNNFLVTRMLAWYLENCPTLINAEMISELTADGSITPKEGCAAILAEVLGLDASRSAQDRHLIRSYINPSVRILDAKKYKSNPYYKNIRIDNVKDGEWEYKNERYPAFRAMICDDMTILEDFTEIPPIGFFTEDFDFPAVLEGGNEWMTLTPVDLDTSDSAIERAHGKVVTFGLGLGYYAYMVSERECVDSITVVEKSEKVIKLFEKHILPQFPNRDKVRVICADAFEYAEHECPLEEYDFAFVDTWRDASDGAPMYRRMKALEHLSPKTEFAYWIEGFLVSRCRAELFGELEEELDSGRSELTYEQVVKKLKAPLAE